MPHPRSGAELEYSKWFQFLLGLLDVDVEYSDEMMVKESIQLQLEVRMGYRTKQDESTAWHELIETTVNRELLCSIDAHKVSITHKILLYLNISSALEATTTTAQLLTFSSSGQTAILTTY